MTVKKEKCPTCKGWGFTLIDCDDCSGTGLAGNYISPNCMKCNGSGVLEVPAADHLCKGVDRQIPDYGTI